MPPRREAFFMGHGADSRFCLVSRPEGRSHGILIHVHAFAEELNRSRHMVALAARDAAEAGWTVLQMDLHGCGDSAGDFGEARWQGWLGDLDRAHDWARSERQQQDPAGEQRPIVLWPLRGGSLLAAAWLQSRAAALPVLAWQPVLHGKTHLTQFLRIRLGADLAQSKDGHDVIAQLRERLAAGQPVDVGGYTLAPDIAEALAQHDFRLPAHHGAPVQILEIGSGEPPTPTPATGRWLDEHRLAGGQAARAQAVSGPRFWQSTEVETAMALIPPSLAFLRELAA